MGKTITPKPATRIYTDYEESYTCDKCGKELDANGIDDKFPNEVILLLNQDECVSSKFRKYFCQICLGKIWDRMCKALGVDPEDISGSDFEND